MDFVACIQKWQRHAGRHHLPWQGQAPYQVWLSEIMLQQTQVSTVLAYYDRFLQRFPTLASLAQASQDEVMPYWAGLGYYARARNLHACAQVVWQRYNGQFPSDPALLAQLPGIGQSTANAIASACFGVPSPILDGNVKRVFCRYFGITGYGTATEKALWAKAYALAAPYTHLDNYNQGLMDLGAMVCKRQQPRCEACPLREHCYAYRHQAQAQLPEKKPPRRKSLYACYLGIYTHAEQLWLEQRPNQGIWGGLWALPQWPHTQTLPKTAQKMATFSHAFTHYTLEITPVLMPTASLPIPSYGKGIQGTLSGQWHHWDQLPSLALATPIRQIIDGLLDSDLLRTQQTSA